MFAPVRCCFDVMFLLFASLFALRGRSHRVAWGGECHSYCCNILVAKEKSPETMDKLSLSLCDMLEVSIFSCTRIVHFIAIA